MDKQVTLEGFLNDSIIAKAVLRRNSLDKARMLVRNKRRVHVLELEAVINIMSCFVIT